jgi:hypothetical protein
MLLGQVVAEDGDTITFAVASRLGDAPSFGICGTHQIPRRLCRLKRRDLSYRPPRELDELKLPLVEMLRLGRESWPTEDAYAALTDP